MQVTDLDNKMVAKNLKYRETIYIILYEQNNFVIR